MDEDSVGGSAESRRVRAYRAPLVVTTLLVALLGLWAHQEWRREKEMHLEHSRRFVDGFGRSMEMLLIDDAYRTGVADTAHLSMMLNRIVRASRPMKFVVVLQGTTRGAQSVDAPDVIPPPTQTLDDRRAGELFVIWRSIPAITGELRARPPCTELQSPSGEHATLVVGLERRLPPGMSARARNELLLKLSLAVLCVAAVAVLWIQSIHARVLASELDVERAEREHLEELGLAAAGLAHETRNPLGIILGLAQRIAANPRDSKRNEQMMEQIIDAAESASARLGEFMTYASQRRPKLEEVDVREAADRIVDVLVRDFEAHGVAIRVEADPVHIWCDAEMLQQILVNLLQNSLHASDAGSAATIRFRQTGQTGVLSVEDQGHGIPGDLLPDVFKPYVSGRGDGHGLGLAIVRQFVHQHGWTIRIGSSSNGGTAVEIGKIPVADQHGRHT